MGFVHLQWAAGLSSPPPRLFSRAANGGRPAGHGHPADRSCLAAAAGRDVARGRGRRGQLELSAQQLRLVRVQPAVPPPEKRGGAAPLAPGHEPGRANAAGAVFALDASDQQLGQPVWGAAPPGVPEDQQPQQGRKHVQRPYHSPVRPLCLELQQRPGRAQFAVRAPEDGAQGAHLHAQGPSQAQKPPVDPRARRRPVQQRGPLGSDGGRGRCGRLSCDQQLLQALQHHRPQEFPTPLAAPLPQLPQSGQ